MKGTVRERRGREHVLYNLILYDNNWIDRTVSRLMYIVYVPTMGESIL